MTTAFSPRLMAPQPAARTSDEVAVQPVSHDIDYKGIYLRSILAVSVLFLIGVGVPMSMFLDNFTSGMGLGAFCAVWGGPSFGVMAGSAGVSAAQERLEGH